MSVPAAVFASPGGVLPLAAAAVAALIFLTWAISVRLRDASVVDPVWGPAFVAVALIAAVAGGGAGARRWLLFGLTAAWGMRLGWHLTRRKLGERAEDRRYAAMRRRHPDHFALWTLWAVYGLQGMLIILISLPIQVASQRHGSLSWTAAPGIVVYAIGFLFESIGDGQLRRFRADPANKDGVIDRGLWRYTRHPNYFGDACVWWGLWLVALPAGGTWWTVVAPVVMTLLLTRISGRQLLEQDIGERRPQYADYINRTSGFIPRPPRS